MQQAQMGRRGFLQSSAAAAGAVTLGTLGIARSVHAAGSDVLKIALIGCGGRGTGAAANCLNVQKTLGEKIHLVAVADAFEDRARAALERLKKEHADQIDVTPEHVFVGLDAYKKAIDCGVTWCSWPRRPASARMHYAYAVAKAASTSSWRSPAAPTPRATAR